MLSERDHFAVTWSARLSLPLLDPAGFDDAVFARTGLTYAAVDLSAFHELPTVLAVVRAPAGFAGALGVGAAAAPTIERACWKALAEAFATRSAGAKLALLAGGGTPTATGIATFDDHILRYADHRRTGATAFLDASPARVAADTVRPLDGTGAPEWLETLCRRVAAAGSTAYAVDVTSPDVASLGLIVTRVIAPELCRLDVSHDARFLGGRRLYEAAGGARPSLRARAQPSDDLSPDPHPFP